jgi:DNA (cytosine-5)-methyltransferase 1
MNYYNEIDPFAALWLRNLISAGHIPEGHVDERSISDVQPDDLTPYTQCHFFAGIGIWALAIRSSGWPDDRPVWSGSCPCQPFSVIGEGGGFADERHLWPHFHYLIEQCRPPVVFGEQVASKDGLDWLDLVLTDLEGSGYAAAAFDLSAAGFGAPHIRQRLFWVGDTEYPGLEGHDRYGAVETGRAQPSRPIAEAGGSRGPWSEADWLLFSDGKKRPNEPGISPLADVNPNSVGLLRAYGNAVVTEVAQSFVTSYMERT